MLQLMAMVVLLCCLTAFVLTRCAVSGAGTQPQGKQRILVLTKSSGFEHDVIKREGEALSLAEQTLVHLGEMHGWDVTCTKDAGLVNADNLKNYDLVLFYTTGELTEEGNDKNPPMSEQGRHDLIEFVRNGGGFIGSHTSGDTFHDWVEGGIKPYIDMLCGEFETHGAQFVGTVRVVDPDHPTMSGFPSELSMNDEWYIYKNVNEDTMHVLAMLDTTSEREKQEVYDRPSYPIIWCRTFGNGRLFHCGLGHPPEVWANEVFQNMLVNAVVWVTGEGPGNAAPNYHEHVE